MPLRSMPHTTLAVGEQGLLQDPRWVRLLDLQASDRKDTASSRIVRYEVKRSKASWNQKTNRKSQSRMRSGKIVLDQSMDYQS